MSEKVARTLAPPRLFIRNKRDCKSARKTILAISDCRYWRYKGIPSYWFGPDSFKCSAANESASLDEIYLVAAVHALTAAKYLIDSHY